MIFEIRNYQILLILLILTNNKNATKDLSR